MRLILVRHGETPWNKEGRFQGQSQIGLSEHGIMQARRIPKALLPMNPEAIYASPLTRTLMTAQEISKALSVPAVPLEGIKEANLGKLEGITGHQMRTQYADIYNAWREDPSDVVFPGGESIRQLQDRAWRAIEEVEKTHRDGTVVAVSHNFAIRAILCKFIGLPLSRFHMLRVDLASVSVLQSNSRTRQVITINERCHLSLDAPDGD